MQDRTQQALDQLLVLAAQTGDPAAAAALARRWSRRLTLHAMRHVRDPDAAREIAQETWLAILAGLPRLADPARFRAWAYAILRNKTADSIRRRRRRPESLPEIAVGPPEDDGSAEVRAALARLDADDRELIILRHVEGLSLAELAIVFDRKSKTITSRLHSARGRLRAELEPKGASHDITDRCTRR
ncbi:MAG: RNA polymerase sigma factor [Planctomycetota bacterium]